MRAILPTPVLNDIFNLAHKPSDVAVNHLCDYLDELGLMISNINNYDHAIVMELSGFRNDNKIAGDLRVDRIRRVFDITMSVGDFTFLPLSGNWDSVLDYINQALMAAGT